MLEGWRADPLEAGALGFGGLNRRRRGEAFVSRGASELLNDVAKVVFVDIVDGGLMLMLMLLSGGL